MSHRTKLIFLAMFLALLGIPASYVYFSWRPREPIRFRYLDQFVKEEYGTPNRYLVLEAVNVSPWSVHLDDATLTMDISPHTRAAWAAESGQQAGSYHGIGVGEIPDLGGIEIERPAADPRDPLAGLRPMRPGEARRCTVLVYFDTTLQRAPADKLRVYYSWASKTKRQYERLKFWWGGIAPDWLTPDGISHLEGEGSMAPLTIPGHPVPFSPAADSSAPSQR